MASSQDMADPKRRSEIFRICKQVLPVLDTSRLKVIESPASTMPLSPMSTSGWTTENVRGSIGGRDHGPRGYHATCVSYSFLDPHKGEKERHGFRRSKHRSVNQARNTVRCWATSMKGRRHLESISPKRMKKISWIMTSNELPLLLMLLVCRSVPHSRVPSQQFVLSHLSRRKEPG